MRSKYKYLIGVLVVALALLGLAIAMRGQAPPPAPKEYKLTELQQLRLSNMQKDALLLKAQMESVQRQFNEKVTELMSSAQKVKLKNGWPPDTTFDVDKLTFSAPPPKETKQ